MPTCPICDKPGQPAFKPFCSQGCRDRDLLQWMNEGYRVPARTEEDPDSSWDGLDSPDRHP